MDVAIFVTDGVADFGFTAVLETFNMANALLSELEDPPEPWHVRTVALGHSVRSGHGHLVPTVPLDGISDAIDVMIMPAGGGPRCRRTHRTRIVTHESAIRRTNLCDAAKRYAPGSRLHGDVLPRRGRSPGWPQATTSWWLGPVFRRRYPEVEVHEGLILCRASGATTAGAVLSHLDLALSFIAPVSPTLAELVARYMLVGARVDQGESAIPEVIARADPLVAAFECWVRDRLDEQFSIADAARALGTTTRSLQRATQAELGMPPGTSSTRFASTGQVDCCGRPK